MPVEQATGRGAKRVIASRRSRCRSAHKSQKYCLKAMQFSWTYPLLGKVDASRAERKYANQLVSSGNCDSRHSSPSYQNFNLATFSRLSRRRYLEDAGVGAWKERRRAGGVGLGRGRSGGGPSANPRERTIAELKTFRKDEVRLIRPLIALGLDPGIGFHNAADLRTGSANPFRSTTLISLTSARY